MSSFKHQRRPSVSDWFSSLRRQPKSKKLGSAPSKGLQRSCIDLSGSNSTFYNDVYEYSDDKSLINTKNVRDFCSQCCCKTTSSSGSSSPSASLSSATRKIDDTMKLIHRDEKNEFKIKTDLTTDIQISQLPQNDSALMFKKRSEFKKTTTMTVTRTTILKRTNRVGLVFNENGELITDLDTLRANSLNSLLDEDSFRPHKSFDGDFLFIDDSSSCPSDINEDSGGNNGDKVSNSCNNNSSKNICPKCFGNLQISHVDTMNAKRIKQIKDELCEVVNEMEALDSQDDCKHSNKDKQMSIGRKKFNMDPKKGIEYLVDNHLLRMVPQDIAHFLYKGEGLNKTAIGDYLGEKNDFNEQVLKAFVELHDFTNLILVQALRQFLWSFRLPGEAQKIDRMMECFAQRYCQLNPDIFTNTDTCYVLSFAIIMLNTSLHNPSVKEKPTVEQFISMNRGINNGGDLPRGLLESLYESIRTEPFKIPQDDGNDLMHTFFNPDKEGWLWKQGGRYKSWKRRWFILNDNCLYYFEYTTDKEPRGIIPLENISVREIHDRSKPHCFELYASGGADIIKACKTDSEGKVVEGKHTVYRMSAATEEDKQEWIKRLTQSISHNPFYDILVQRKKKALAKS
ncbi:unnamed protein product [Hermetia illucens]|uniref:Cytohesin-1 n=1 Tax=Hermetia illucens TaxID=343691 RepID=A0A7R8YUY7_HERIL|nr:cytohesin-1 isoform X1 [Hermetia illucens]CAD7086297.1 unnamed protein product [Hermetia illucens]